MTKETGKTIKKQNMEALTEYQKTLWEKPRLRYLFFELTDQCNLNCIHCGSRCEGANHTYLDFNVIDRTLTEVAKTYGTDDIMICITGGEPLLAPSLCKVISRSAELGFGVGMTTNGTLITEEAAKELADAGLGTVAVSIDGLGSVHDEFRRSIGSFDKAVEGIRNLRKAGIYAQALTVVHKDNLYKLPEIYDFLMAEDIYSWRLTNVDPIGRACDNSALFLDGAELRLLYDFIRAKRFMAGQRMHISYGCSHFLTYEYENELRDYYFQCMAGTMVASVAANGDILACLDVERLPELVQGNAYRDDFVSIWQECFYQYRTDRSLQCEMCRACEDRTACMGDSAHTWDFRGRKPNYCAKQLLEE